MWLKVFNFQAHLMIRNKLGCLFKNKLGCFPDNTGEIKNLHIPSKVSSNSLPSELL